MACGLKPVVYEYPGASEVFPASVLFRDAEGAVRLIRELAFDSQSYHDWVASRFDLKAQCGEVESVLRRLFGGPPASSRLQFFARTARWIAQRVSSPRPFP
jgi:hypothetical protein